MTLIGKGYLNELSVFRATSESVPFNQNIKMKFRAKGVSSVLGIVAIEWLCKLVKEGIKSIHTY